MQVCCENQNGETTLELFFPLASTSEGEKVKIVFLRDNGLLRERLLSMGIYINDEIKVIQKQVGGAMLIEKMGSRYALGGGNGL